jgi:hypothetical protein
VRFGVRIPLLNVGLRERALVKHGSRRVDQIARGTEPCRRPRPSSSLCRHQ